MASVTGTLDNATSVERTGAATADFEVETTADLDLFLERTAAAEATCFQCEGWLRPLVAILAPAASARHLFVMVSKGGSDRVVAGLPLVVTREHGLTVATIASFGVSDYAAPLVGAGAPTTAAEAARMWQCIASRLSGIDLVRFTTMPEQVGARVNPLVLLPGTLPSRHAAHAVTLDGTVEDYLRARGKKYRKEAERCYRLLEKAGRWVFHRAETDDEIVAAYTALTLQQRARRERAGDAYFLDRPEYVSFYERLMDEGSRLGFAHLFKLTVEGETIATLFGVTHGSAFTLLRISTAGDAWRQLSPGRLIVLEAMRYFLARGVRTFDMGIGAYAFKDGLGAEAAPLVDLTIPLTFKARPAALLARAKEKARSYPRLFDFAKRLAGR